MIYLLYGLEEFLINKEIKKIITSNNIDNININKYDLEETLIENIIEDASMSSLFSDKKLIIINNSYIFTGKGSSLEHNTDLFERYLGDINPDTILIFTVFHDKLDERKKNVKKIKVNGLVKEFNKEFNINNLVKTMFEDYQISSSDINYLISRTGNNLDLIENEANKLMSFKINEKSINKEDITNLVSLNIDADIFKLIDELINKNKDQALNIYAELIKINEEPIKILVMIANQFRLMYQVKELTLKGYTEGDIASLLKVHPYRVKLAREKSRNYESIKLLSYLEELVNLDYAIKTGKVDKNLGLELFIINV